MLERSFFQLGQIKSYAYGQYMIMEVRYTDPLSASLYTAFALQGLGRPGCRDCHCLIHSRRERGSLGGGGNDLPGVPPVPFSEDSEADLWILELLEAPCDAYATNDDASGAKTIVSVYI